MQATAIPPGPERVAYMQNLDGDLQGKLVMYKMWSKMLEDNGGVAPVIHTNK